MKTCQKCRKEKRLREFGVSTRHLDGRLNSCRVCVNAYARAHRRDNPDMYWKSRLQAKYGMSWEAFSVMSAEQDGKCAICGRDPQVAGTRWGKLVVDHDHETDEVRGLLCASCNSAIGLLGDDPQVIMSAAAYLMTRSVVLEES